MKPILTTCFSTHIERWFAISLFLVCVAMGAPSNALAAPYKPMSVDDVVVEVPHSITTLNRQRNGGINKLYGEKTPQTSEAGSLTLALENARHYITLAKKTHNNRWYGFAQSALKPWWNKSKDNQELALIKAHLYLLKHQFESALSVLNQVLNRRQRHPEALTMRANTYIMLGQYNQAMSDCQQVAFTSSPVLGVNCLARVKSLSGSGQDALKQVLSVLNTNLNLSALEKFETHLNAAIFAHRLNQVTLAKVHYSLSYAINPNDRFLMGNYTDFLIEQAQWSLLGRIIDKDSNVLDQRIKLAIYLNEIDTQSISPLVAMIDQEFQHLKSVNSEFPHKEYARYLLALKQEPSSALNSAFKNWKIQQDPSSALLILRCALASRNRSLAQPVIDWVQQTGLYDHRIMRVMESLERIYTEL